MVAITGSLGSDKVNGTKNGDTIDLYSDSDSTNGLVANVTAYGGEGDDFIRGKGGSDFFYGGAGNDRVFGNGGGDEIDGNEGNDDVRGGGGNDKLLYSFAENSGAIDAYDGGNGIDSLKLKLSYSESVHYATQLSALQSFLATSDALVDTNASQTFTFGDRSLSVKNIESSSIETFNTAPAVGDATSSIDADLATVVDGSVTVADLDPYDVVTVTATAGAYGIFTVDNSGSWTYDLNESLAALQALDTTDEGLLESITVTGTDLAGATETGTVSITINGVNDKPEAGDDQSVTVAENVDDAAVLATIAGSDIDIESLSYDILNGNDDGLFEINADGEISLASGQALDYETDELNGPYTFTVQVSDGQLSDTAEVTLNVSDIEEYVILQPGPSEGMDVWINNAFSYDSNYGVDDNILKVGGWGDLYYSLIKFDVSDMPEASSAKIMLYHDLDFVYEVGYTPTAMQLYRVDGPWDEELGWYSGQPATTFIGSLSTPGDGWYEIDVTDLFDEWQDGQNFGIELRPTSTNKAVNLFLSSDYEDPSLRPMLVIEPAAEPVG